MANKSKKAKTSVKKSTSGAIKSVKNIRPTTAPVSHEEKVETPKEVLVSEVEEVVVKEEQPTDTQIAEPENQKAEPKAKKDDKEKAKTSAKKKEKKPSVVAKRFRETSSELKKVSWPSFSKVVKQTGVVIAVVLIFAVIVFGIDRLLSLLFDLFTKGLV